MKTKGSLTSGCPIALLQYTFIRRSRIKMYVSPAFVAVVSVYSLMYLKESLTLAR